MLRKPIRLFIAVAMVASLAAVLPAAALPPGVVQADYKDIMPLSQVKPGMKAYGLTVFKGTKIEKFNVEIIGLMRKMNNGKDLILARMSGGPITERQANIMQGMSGSPVYINGKIIGAVAYGPGGFSKEPLAMLTPIEDMLDSLDPKLPSKPSGLSTLDTPVKSGASTYNRIEIRNPADAGTAAGVGTLVMTPLMTPVSVSGISARGLNKLAEIFEPFGLQPVAGPGGKTDIVPTELRPGSAFGLSLTTGDIDMTATGTLTYRRGNKMVGFGHPMFNIGPIDAPLSTAYVLDVFPSYQVSFKLAMPMKVVGHITQDRPWSVGGEIGKMADTIPLTINVDNQAIGRKKTLHVNVINHPMLAPKLIVLSAAEAITELNGIPNDAMAEVRTEINADEVGKIVRENEFFDPTTIEAAALDDMQGLVNILSNNKFHPINVKSVNMSVTIRSGRKTASVERIIVDRSKYEPGDTVKVAVEMRPYKGDRFTKTIAIKIPENAPDGRVTLQVKGGMSGGGDGPMIVIAADGAPRMSSGGGSSADNVQQVIDKFLEREKNNDLVAKLLLPSSSVSVGGEKLSGLPDAIAGVMKNPRASAGRTEREEVKTVVPMDYVMMGEQSVPIKIERVRHGEKRAMQPPSGGPDGPPDSQPTPPQPPDGDEMMNDDFGGYSASTPVQLATPAQPSVSVDESPVDAPPAGVATPANPVDAPVTPNAGSDAKPAEKPVGRQPAVWKQTTYKDFANGTFSGTAVSTSDEVVMVPALAKLAELPEMYAWKVLPDGTGGAYIGTGSNGNVYHVSGDGKASVVFKTGEIAVQSLARDGSGNLYAGTSPHGKVFKIDSSGKGSLLFTTSEKYVLALAASGENIFAGVGDAGKVYKISPGGKGELFASVNDASILALAIDASGNIYAGAGRDGVVYKISPDGKASPLYNAAEDSIASVAVDSRGNVYAATGTAKGNVYKIKPSGEVSTVYDKAPKALSMAVDSHDNIYVASDEQIIKITPDEKVMTLDSGRAGAQFVSVAVAGDGTVLAGTANSAALYVGKPAAQSTYESSVRDAGTTSRWGVINWIASTPEGAATRLLTRTGNVSEPDSSWNTWSEARGPGQSVTSPAARYIQYRAILSGTNEASPALQQVTVAYLPENRGPKVTISEPQLGAVISHNQSIRWSGSDPDKDTLTYDIYYSADSGKTWQRIGSGVKSASASTAPLAALAPKSEAKAAAKPIEPKKVAAAAQPSKADMMAQLRTELDQHPEIPQEVKDQMIEDAPSAIDKAVSASGDESEPADTAPASNGGASIKQTSYNWDTTKVPDGSYMIKVVATDRVSNASGFQTGEKVVGPVVVANTPPRVSVFKKTVTVAVDGTVSVEGYAYGNNVALAGVQFKVDSGDWMSASATDGIFDTTSEAFTITTDALSKGAHTIEVKAIDAAGNSAADKVTANVK